MMRQRHGPSDWLPAPSMRHAPRWPLTMAAAAAGRLRLLLDQRRVSMARQALVLVVQRLQGVGRGR